MITKKRRSKRQRTRRSNFAKPRLERLEDRNLLATFAVNSFEDLADANPGDGICDDGSGQCTLRAAVMEANAWPGDDTAVLSDGVYTLDLDGSSENAAETGDLDVSDTTGGLAIIGGGPLTVIDSFGLGDRLFDVHPDANLVLDSIKLRGGNSGANNGGAISNDAALTIRNTTLEHNTTTGDGGAISNISSGTLFVYGSTFSNNTAGSSGGAISNFGDMIVIDSTFFGNLANTNGGAIRNGGGATVINSTLTANRADANDDDVGSGGGFYSPGDSSTLINTIVAENYLGTGPTPNDIAGTVTADSHHNLIGDLGSSGGLVDGTNDNIVGVDALLGAPGPNGGPTETVPLLSGSPAIDNGDAESVLQFDQRGVERPQDGDGNGIATIDIGAYELLAEQELYEIHGTKWEDVNGDGRRNSDEPGLSGVMIYADLDNDGVLDPAEPSTITVEDDPATPEDETGTYRLSGLPLGPVVVREVVPDGWEQTTPNPPLVTIAEQTLSLGDDFEDGEIDDSLWNVTESEGNESIQVSETSGKLQIVGSTPGAYAGIESRFELNGDFDVSIDYAWVSYGGHDARIQLSARDTASDATVKLNYHRYGGGSSQELILHYFDGATSRIVKVNWGMPLEGKLRLARVGDSFSAFYWKDGDWVSAGSVNAFTTPVTARMTGDNTSIATPFEVHLDNFHAVAESLGNALDFGNRQLNRLKTEFQITDPGGNSISSVVEGDEFLLIAYVTDPRDSPSGVFAFFQDVTYDTTLTSPAGFIVYGTNYPNVQSGDPSIPGLIDEVGAVAGLQGSGVARTELFRIPMLATQAGLLTFAADPADILPQHDSLLFDEAEPVAIADIEYGSITIDILPRCTANDESFTTDEDHALHTNVVGNDVCGVADVIGFDRQSERGAVVSINADGGLRYDPRDAAQYLAPGESLQDTFTYTISDSHGTTATATVTISVTGVNDAPAALDDVYETDEDAALLVATLGVLNNDMDVDASDTRAVTQVQGAPANVGEPTPTDKGATVTVLADGSFAYDPTDSPTLQALSAGESLEDTFTYTISDAHGATATATVTISVDGVNDAPIVSNPLADLRVDEDAPDEVIELTDVFTDLEDGSDLTLSVESNALTLVAASLDDTALTLTFGADQHGEATIRVMAQDRGGSTVVDEFTVTVSPVNDAPIVATPIQDQLLNNEQPMPTREWVFPLNGNTFVDPDGDPLSYEAAPLPDWLSFDSSTLTFRGIPQLSDLGTYTITVSATDGGGLSITDSITIHVVNPHQNPTNPYDVNADGFVTPIDALLVINQMNADGPSALPIPRLSDPPPFVDVNNDLFITPIDALLVINHLNQNSAVGEGEAVAKAETLAPLSGTFDTGVAATAQADRGSTRDEQPDEARDIVFGNMSRVPSVLTAASTATVVGDASEVDELSVLDWELESILSDLANEETLSSVY
ncbi:MAG: Ig-like domain-containing protein [Planctomycetota bacterium]|nr:Ig-like domain-containing protein [Planctomycetota bacterium]